MRVWRHYTYTVNKLIRHIALLFLCLLAVESMAQIPWVAATNGPTQVLEIPSIWTVQVDSSIAGTGDALGVFVVDSNGVELCVGAISLSDSAGYLTVYGQDSSNAGLAAGEILKFKLYNQEKQCEIVNVSVVGDSGDVYFSPGDSTIITSVEAFSSSINYPITEACQGIEEILYSSEFNAVTYTGTFGLELDSVTGAIDVLQSQSGNHIVHFNSDICLELDSVFVSIYDQPTLAINGDTVFCESKSVEMTVVTNGTSVFWSNGDTSLATSYLAPSLGYVSVTNDNGCVEIDTFNLTVKDSFNLNDLEVNHVSSRCKDSTELLFDVSILPTSQYAIVLNSDTAGWTNEQLQTQVSSGNYEVVVVDEIGCSSSLGIVVEDETINLEEIALIISQPECGGVGEVQGFYNNEELTLLIENQNPTSLQSGFYDLSLDLDDECIIPFVDKIEIVNPVGCQSEVMYPDTDGAEATFYIATEGSTRIIDRNGQLVRSLQTPGHWDGRDDNNELVPMGEYYIITNESSSVTISVIR